MSVSRRRFLKHGAFAAVAFPAVASGGFPGEKPHSATRQNTQVQFRGHLKVDRSTYEGLVGSSFKVTTTSGKPTTVYLRLIAVSDLPAIVPVNPASMAVPPKKSSATVPTPNGYILTFSADGTSLAQGTYIFEGSQLGTFPLFIVPAGSGQYTAVFNLL